MALWTYLSGALLIKPALKLSELVIDADKDWKRNGITNMKQVAAGMNEGDAIYKGETRMEKSSPGSIGTVLTTHDFGNDPTWDYPP
jgi:hypothetical protein